MNGWPGFFDTADQRLGMKGWGLSLDYVLAPGVLLTLEGYDLKASAGRPSWATCGSASSAEASPSGSDPS